MEDSQGFARVLANDFCLTVSQAQQVLDLLAPSEDVYDLEATAAVLTFSAEHGIDPEQLAGFVSQLIARRMPLLPHVREPRRVRKAREKFPAEKLVRWWNAVSARLRSIGIGAEDL